MKAQIKRALLLALRQCDGMPMPEMALTSAARLLVRPNTATLSDVTDALREVEALGFAAGLTDELTGETSWTLTEKGIHKARAL